MGSLPSTLREITRAGYKLLKRMPCADCGDTVELWHTTHRKQIVFNAMSQPGDAADPHRGTCKALLQREERKRVQAMPINVFAAQQRAAAVIVIDDACESDWTVANVCLVDPAEIHASIVGAADKIRDMLTERFNAEAR